MFQFLSVLVLVAAVYYFTPDQSAPLQRRAPVPASNSCKETTPLKSKCSNGNAFVFYNGPSEHTLSILEKLKTLKVNATFMIESGQFTDWAIVNKIVSYNMGVGISVTQKNKGTTSIMSLVNAERDLWLSKVGIVPKFVSYTTNQLDDATNTVLLNNNYYPTRWTVDAKDFENDEVVIKTVLSGADNDVLIFNEFKESNFTANTLEWFFNTTKVPFNDLMSCYGTSNPYWGNCTEAVIPPQDDHFSTFASTTSSKKSDSTEKSSVPSSGSRLRWLLSF